MITKARITRTSALEKAISSKLRNLVCLLTCFWHTLTWDFAKANLTLSPTTVNDDWWRGKLHGKTGLFPQNHVVKIE